MSSRAVTTRVRTAAPVAVMSPSAVVAALASAIEGDAEEPEPVGRLRADDRRVLAHAAGEHEHVEAPERRHHRRDRGAQAVHVDGNGEAGVVVGPRRRARAMSPVPARPARPDRS